MCVEEGCHMAAKYNTTFSWKQSKKYRSSKSAICVFNKNVLQILRILWVQTKVMGKEPKSNPIKFKYFLWRGDTGWHTGEMLSILQILDPLLAISLKSKAGSSWPGYVSFLCSLPLGPTACILVFFKYLHCYIPVLGCWRTWSPAGAVWIRSGKCGCGGKTWE